MQGKCDKISTVPVTDSQFSLKTHFICRFILKTENYAFSELSFSCVTFKGLFVRQAIFKIKKMVGRTCNDHSEKFCVLFLDIFASQIRIFFIAKLIVELIEMLLKQVNIMIMTDISQT